MVQELLFFYHYRFKKPVLSHKPLRVWIEPTNVCNLRCKTCPQSILPMPAKGFIEPDLVRKIAGELSIFRPRLTTLHLAGEPLLHPKIAEIVQMISSQGLPVTFSTNGVLLIEGMIEDLIRSGLNAIRIDFAEDKEVYETIRQKAVWETVYNNIRTLLEIREKRGLLEPRVFLVNIDVSGGEKEAIRKLARLAQLFPGHRVEVSNLALHSWAGEFAKRSESDTALGSLGLAPRGSHYFPCYHIFSSFVVTWDGDVVPCCRDLNKDYVVGSVKDRSILDLWNSERLVELRNKQSRKDIADLPLCRHCTQLWMPQTFLGLAVRSLQRFLFVKFGRSPLGMR